MIKELINRLGLWRGAISEVKIEANEQGYSYITMTVSERTIEGDKVFRAPMVTPSGFIGAPNDTNNAVGLNIGGIQYNPVIAGVVHAVAANDARFDDLLQGESYVYSNQYCVKVKNDEVVVYLGNGVVDKNVNLIVGEWASKINKDLLTQIQDLYSKLALVEAKYDTHIHGGAAGNTTQPSNTISFGEISEEIATDLTAVNTNKVFINNSGSLPEE